MWGWKTADRVVEPSVSFDEAKRIVQAAGFEIATSNPKHCVFKRRGTESGWTKFAPEGENLPLELAITEEAAGVHFYVLNKSQATSAVLRGVTLPG